MVIAVYSSFLIVYKKLTYSEGDKSYIPKVAG